MTATSAPFDGSPKLKVWSPTLGSRRFADSAKVPEPDVSSSVPPSGRNPDTGDLYVDRILHSLEEPNEPILFNEDFVIKVPDEQISSCGLAFFSEQRVASLTSRMGSAHLRELIEKLDNIIVERLSLTRPSPWTRIQFMKPPKGPQVTSDEARDYIRAYFENLHPVYPFLDRDIFETKAFSPQLPHVLDQNPIFSALYHAVLALGSQFFRQGTYSPGTGKSWELFQVSLGHMAEIILPRESLENVQAITAMSIYALNACCLQIDDALVAHAARMAIVLRYHRSSAAQSDQARVFWVIYALEKQQCLLSRCSSMIPDEDIACPAPSTPESVVGAYNAFLTFVRIGRISSVAYQSLFSISAAQKSAPVLQAAIVHMRGLLEEWRMGIPAAFRPCEPANFDALTDASTRLAVLQTHYLYLGLIISIERLTLHLDKERGAASQRSRVNLMNAARTIVDLSRYIELEPYVPVAMIDFASKGALPGRVIPEFAQIAREYFIKVQTQGITEAERASDAKDDALGPKESPGTREKAGEPSTEMQQDDPAAEESWANTIGSDYLSYPTPANFEVPTDMQMWDAGDFRSIFGTAFPEWAMGPDVALGSLGLTDGGR
ncbi:hypothetical protein ACHAPS_003555 [Verticillium nonalfalfae]